MVTQKSHRAGAAAADGRQGWINGIDARSGGYLAPPPVLERLAAMAQGQTSEEAGRARALRQWARAGAGKTRRGPKEGIDPGRIEEAGWGIVFAGEAPDVEAVREALRPLLDLRRAQASARREHFYRELAGEQSLLPGETKSEFLARHGAGPGPADPERLPYYLLLAGDPELLPFSFQYQLDVQYAVGRVHFDTVEEYRRYAESVVAAETGRIRRPRRACFFATANQGDPATALTSAHLAVPLAAAAGRDLPGWSVQTNLGSEATRARLGGLLEPGEAPALLFTACHGLGFPAGDAGQREHQGALVCQDWPGPGAHGIEREHYFAAEDVADAACPAGMVAFCFACFGAGTPRWDDFAASGGSARRALAPRAFLSRLPQRLLAHPGGGALAVVGHVERAWGFSFLWPRAGEQTGVFESALRRLLLGQPVGWAMEVFNQRYAELASDLAAELEALGFGKRADQKALSDLWTASRDARNFTIVGDPAVRLAVAPLAAAAADPAASPLPRGEAR